MGINFANISKINVEDINVESIGNKLIMTDIHYLRSNYDKKESDIYQDTKLASQSWAHLHESYCHAFYRIIGLPVIHKNKVEFYNPGFYGNEDSDTEKLRRANIDNNQDENLLVMERKREQFSFDNNHNFNKSTMKLKYRIEMLQYPIQTNMLDGSLTDAFSPDSKQIIDNYPGRILFKRVAKILRPFKCVPNITNQIEPVTNKICAPFVLQDKTLNQTLSRTYLEFVSRIRFNSDIISKSSKNEYKTQLEQQMKAINVLNSFNSNINNFNDVESYIFLQMFNSFVSICQAVKKTIAKNSKVAEELNKIINEQQVTFSDEDVSFDILTNSINALQKEISIREYILSYLPIDPINSDGITLSNKINCKLSNTFVSFVEGDVKSLKKKLTELQHQKANNLSKFKTTNKYTFYSLGEVTGIGIVDIIAIMMSLWLLPQEQLLAFFDNSSFDRLYKNVDLRNEVVQKRYNVRNGYDYSIGIYEAVNNMDKIVLSLLELADDIIKSSS